MPSPRAPQQPRLPAWWAAGLAIVAGLVGVLAFPRLGWWPLAIVSVAGLSVAVDGHRARTGAWLGWLYGLAFFVPLLQWTGIYVGPAPWLILAVAEAAFCAVLGAMLPLVQRLPGGPLWIACSWVLQEALRDRLPFGGFPWGRLAFSQAQSPLRWIAALGGAPLVSFAVALAGGGLALVVGHARPMSRRPFALGVALVAAVPAVGALLSWPLAPTPQARSRTTTVALVQGSVPALGLQFEQRAQQVLDNHVAETLRLAARIKAGEVPKPSIVLWPEDASDVDPFLHPGAYAKINAAARAVGVPVLVGAILDGPGPTHRRNVGIVWSPTTGPGEQYVKRHPVPFGEYIPLRGLARLVSPDVNLVTRDMVAGTGNGLLGSAPFPLGDVICFEIAYDGLVRSSVRAGAQALVVQTNNATFGHTAETYQQLAMSQLRAVETGRTVLQVATTGMSAVIAPDGTIEAQSGALFTPDTLVSTIALHTWQTPATRVGAAPEWLLAGLALAALAWSIAARRWAGVSVSQPSRPRPEEMVQT